jgi:hypothetical protein
MRSVRKALEVDVQIVAFACLIPVKSPNGGPDKLEQANPGDYLITNSQGESYPIRADLFLAQYDIVEE